MNYLVTGGAGFIGSHIVDRLLAEDAEKVVVVDNFFLGNMANLSEAMSSGRVVVYREDAKFLTSLETIMEREKTEVVFDLAVKPLPYSFTDPDGAYMVSVEIARNLAYLLKRRSYNELVHFSSSEAYGTAKYVPMDENHPMDPSSPYSAGKAAADLLLLSYARTFDLPLTIVRPFNNYGPRQNMQTYAAVIPITIRRILEGKNPIIEWDGKQTRDFTYVTDTADAAVKLMNCNEALGQVINVGQGKETSIEEIVLTLCKILHHDGIDYKDKRKGDVRRHQADISKAKKLINYEPKVSLEEGLKKTVEWYSRSLAAHG
jgi:UDP-glucose 4-epimerase